MQFCCKQGIHAQGSRSEGPVLPWVDVRPPHGRSRAHRDVNINHRERRSQAANLVGLRIVFVLELAPRFDDLLTYGMDVEEQDECHGLGRAWQWPAKISNTHDVFEVRERRSRPGRVGAWSARRWFRAHGRFWAVWR